MVQHTFTFAVNEFSVGLSQIYLQESEAGSKGYNLPYNEAK